MLEIKLKDVNELEFRYEEGRIQYWKNGNVLTHTCYVGNDHVYANVIVPGVSESGDIRNEALSEFCKRSLRKGDIILECDYKGVPLDNQGPHMQNVREGVQYWRNLEGCLYMTHYHPYGNDWKHPILINLTQDTTETERFNCLSELFKRLEELKLKEVRNIRLEEF